MPASDPSGVLVTEVSALSPGAEMPAPAGIMIFGSETTLVIPADSELMKYFQMSGAGVAEEKKP